MFVDLDWPLNASSLLSASAELLVESETETGLVLRPTVSDHVTVHQGARPRGTTLADGLCFPENWIASNFTCRRPKSNLCYFCLLMSVYNIKLAYRSQMKYFIQFRSSVIPQACRTLYSAVSCEWLNRQLLVLFHFHETWKVEQLTVTGDRGRR